MILLHGNMRDTNNAGEAFHSIVFATDWVHAWHVVLPRAVPPIILQLALIIATAVATVVVAGSYPFVFAVVPAFRRQCAC